MTRREQITSDSAAAATQGNSSAFPTAQGTPNAFPVAQGNVNVPLPSKDPPQAGDEVDPQPNETAGGGQGIHVVNDINMVLDA
ncbi:hypothetical protein K7X08_015994 [Anisodus acutangulus]|uniref:Uncharacterized protein n=1 Tax=Anisodus acutangulus TaxID=402998 RepID=A0A9Q1QYS2_9SOLA|nr:hypothetical protein K7X08_015994 [Anisodus acutangulus]